LDNGIRWPTPAISCQDAAGMLIEIPADHIGTDAVETHDMGAQPMPGVGGHRAGTPAWCTDCGSVRRRTRPERIPRPARRRRLDLAGQEVKHFQRVANEVESGVMAVMVAVIRTDKWQFFYTAIGHI